MRHTGIMIGHFEPLNFGHMSSIIHASGQVKTLNIIITPHPEPNPKYPVTLADKARWLQVACADLPFIKIHVMDDVIIPSNSSQRFDDVELFIAKTNNTLLRVLDKLDIEYTSKQDENAPVIFCAENHPLAKNEMQNLLALNCLSLPVLEGYNAHQIHQNPVKYWSEIHPEAKSNYTKTVAIVGGESSGKTTLVHKLANYFGSDVVLEMGRLYVHTDLGGSEIGLQYSDYPAIAIDHAHALREAVYQAKSPVTIVDTDFVTTQAFCEEYEDKTHPFVSAFIEEYRFDYTIMLDNNVPWISDGMRSLGSDEQRTRFEDRLLNIFHRHGIEPLKISSDDYHQRFVDSLSLIKQLVFGQS